MLSAGYVLRMDSIGACTISMAKPAPTEKNTANWGKAVTGGCVMVAYRCALLSSPLTPPAALAIAALESQNTSSRHAAMTNRSAPPLVGDDMARNPTNDFIQFIAGGSLFGVGIFLFANQVMASSAVTYRGGGWGRYGGGGSMFPIGTPGMGLLMIPLGIGVCLLFTGA